MPYTLEDLRSELPVLRSKVYLNTGTLGPSPQAVTVAYIREYQRWQIEGPGWPKEYLRRRDGLSAVRRDIAGLLSVPTDDIGLSENITAAINWVAASLDFQPQDEVIVGMDEHPANRYPWRALEAMGRVKVVPWPMQGDDEELLAALSSRIGERTRAVTVSHVLQTTGRILPVREICAMCRAAGALSLIDGAQALGQIPVDLRDSEPDVYGFNGHKWLLGPVGTAGLYVRPEVMRTLSLLPAGSGSALSDGMGREEPDVKWLATPRRWEVGTRNWPLFDGLSRSIGILGEIGWDNLFRRSDSLVQAFLEQLPKGVELWRVPRRAAMATVRVPNMTGGELADALYASGRIIVRPVDELLPGSVRLSFAAFNNEHDVDMVLQALEKVARS